MTEDPYVDCGRLRQVSATIEDAIKVVLKLGERYLWVDRYCISQLDPVAKATEMEAMPWIFAGAKATIVALGPDDESGLQGVSTSRNASPHTYTPQGRPFHVYDRTIDEVDSSSWTTRAWTLQEAFLAKRLIFFLSSETVFVCKTSTLSQVGSRVTRQGEQELRSWQPKYVDYHTALDAYTKRALTYESDSLAAFCGFLNAFKEPCYWGVSTSLSMALLNDLADSDPLEAGFVENLQWSHYASRQEYGPMLTHRPLYLSAPTWSWVSYRLGAMAPNPKMDGTSYTIQGCSVRFWREDVRWCSAREFFAVRREPQLVLEPGLKSILLTGIHSLFEAGSKGLYGWTCRSSAKSPTFELLAFDDQHAEYWPEIRESINLENFDETYTFMPRIEAVLIAVHENKTHHAITQETYSSFWLTLEVGEKRDDGIIPATRTGSIQATLGCVSRVEVKELLASLDAARRVYELS